MKRNLLFFALILFSFQTFAQKELYELRVYTMKFGSSAANLNNYLKDAFLPALNRQGVKNIGVFEEIGLSQPQKIYLFIPYSSMSAYEKANEAIQKDAQFLAASKSYSEIPYAKTPYASLTTSLLTAFSGIPKLIKPASGSMLFEMRTYQSGIEEAAGRKVKMFNEGELKIFEDTGLHSVFFGSRIAGPQMPCLTYMLAFKDMEERDANWAKFVSAPAWKQLSGMEEYADLLINIDRVFLKPLDYSQL